ncbi:hypothetical protein Bca4012_083633 [Brassica carinata]
MDSRLQSIVVLLSAVFDRCLMNIFKSTVKVCLTREEIREDFCVNVLLSRNQVQEPSVVTREIFCLELLLHQQETVLCVRQA